MNSSNPFGRRGTSQFNLDSRKGEYQGQNGLENLFTRAAPHLLIRTDQRTRCTCASPDQYTGSIKCTKCFGLGYIVRSVDRFSAYISKSSPRGNNLSNAGYELADSKLIYCGRWVRPSISDLVLEVGWDVDNELVYSRGKLRTVDNVYQVKQPNFIGFESISYIEIVTLGANARKKEIENMLLYSSPTYRNCLNTYDK